jgi:hypothetical protein
MPPKAKKAPKAAGDAVNGKGGKSGTSPPPTPSKTAPAAAKQEEADDKHITGSGKPDQQVYHAEQDAIKAEIDALQVKLVWHPTPHSLGEFLPERFL